MFCWIGILHEDLREFISSNLPASTKKLKVLLGITEQKLGTAISEQLAVEISASDAVKEIVRGNVLSCKLAQWDYLFTIYYKTCCEVSIH